MYGHLYLHYYVLKVAYFYLLYALVCAQIFIFTLYVRLNDSLYAQIFQRMTVNLTTGAVVSVLGLTAHIGSCQ